MNGSRAISGYAVSAAGVVLVSAGIGAVLARWSIANISMLYLLVVLAVAVRYGHGPAVFASLAAFLTFNWFFIEPVHTFTIAQPEELVPLLLFLVVAVVAGQLAAAQRQRAQEARRREREAVALHTLGRHLDATDDLDAALGAVAEHLRAELALTGCAILLPAADDAVRRVVVRASAGDPAAAEGNLSGWLAPATRLPVTPPVGNGRGHWIRVRSPVRQPNTPNRVEHVPLAVGDQTISMLRLVVPRNRTPWTPEESRLLAAAAGQIAAGIERARLRRQATEAEVLRQTDEVRQSILHAVSHDLRTPLASIKGSAESLLRPGIQWSDAQRQTYLVAIRQEADYLIENAVKYTPPGTPIAVGARVEGGAARRAVIDEGPGIPPESLPHVFDTFYRVSGGDRATTKGTGLGLAVARGFVEAHGGTIDVQSPPAGKAHGTVFWFTLPLTASDLPAPPPESGAPAQMSAAR